MKKRIITASVIILIVAVVAAIAVILTHSSAIGYISQANGDQSTTDGASGTGDGNGNGLSPGAAGGDSDPEDGDTSAGKKQLTIFTFDKELDIIVRQYAKMHPEFDFNIVCRENDKDFFYDLNYSLQNGEGSQVDLYCVPATYSQWYIKGGYSGFASTYKELGIDVDSAVKKADIPQNIVEAGTNPKGELIALPYKKNVNLFVYRRSIARDVWGTDDPDRVTDIIGSGTGKWDRFLESAQTLKEHGYYMLPDCKELSGLVETGISGDLISNGKYAADPKWEEYMDVSKRLLDKGFAKNTLPWTDEWRKDLNGEGDKPVFGAFTADNHIKELSGLLKSAGDWAVCLPPVSVDTGFYTGFEDMDYYTGIMVNRNSPNKDALGPLIEWITLDSSETGLQYSLANDTFYSNTDSAGQQKYGGKRAVVSGTVLNSIKNDHSFLDGQNINALIYAALQMPAGKHHSPGMDLFRLWYYETEAYLRGDKDKKTAVADYQKAVKEYEQGWEDMFKVNGFDYSADGILYSLIGTRELNVYSYDEELPELIKQYAKGHPEFNFKVNWYYYAMVDNFSTLGAINDNMQSSGGQVVDIYCVPDTYSHEMIKGEYSKHASTYKELGIDIDADIQKAGIPQYVIDAGTNPDGEVIALPYQAGVNVFMYRRSIANGVWGTDDPDRIAEIIGAGSDKWDSFLQAAQTLKEHGIYIVPGCGDIAGMIDTGIPASGQAADKGYDVNPKWQEFMDISKQMFDNGYMKDEQPWNDGWSNMLNGIGDKPVFGFVLPFEYFKAYTESDHYLKSTAGDWAICVPPFKIKAAFDTGIMVNKDSPNKKALGPLIEWLTLDCSEEGLQYQLANDALYDKGSQLYRIYGGKKAVVSGTILKNTKCNIDFLGGQNINPVIYDVLDTPGGKHDYGGLEVIIFGEWMNKTRAYTNGEVDRKTAVAEFKEAEKKTQSWYKNMLDQYEVSFLFP